MQLLISTNLQYVQLLSAVRPIHYSPENNIFDYTPHMKYVHTYDISPVGGAENVPEMSAYQNAEIDACQVSNCPYGKMMQQ